MKCQNGQLEATQRALTRCHGCSQSLAKLPCELREGSHPPHHCCSRFGRIWMRKWQTDARIGGVDDVDRGFDCLGCVMLHSSKPSLLRVYHPDTTLAGIQIVSASQMSWRKGPAQVSDNLTRGSSHFDYPINDQTPTPSLGSACTHQLLSPHTCNEIDTRGVCASRQNCCFPFRCMRQWTGFVPSPAPTSEYGR